MIRDLLFLLALSGPAQDATTSQPQAPPPAVSPSISVRVERRAETFDYHFDNPSNFEPGPLVPHFFEQRYDADNTWLLITADYRVADTPLSTEFGITPRITTSGSDVDTFLQPSGDVITTGTRGEVRLRSFSIRQRIGLSTWRQWTLGVVVGYRRAAMDYLPSERIVTHTRPPSEIRDMVPGHENTWSDVLESGVMVIAPFDLTPRWRLTAAVDALPIARARLSVSLPDKYAEISRADALSFGAQAGVTLERRGRRWTAGVGTTWGGAWRYSATSHYRNRRAGAAGHLSRSLF